MTGGIEAAGDIATGALIGRAIEPSHGEYAGDGGGGLCLNCGTRLSGPHCHRCGQSAHVHRSLGAIGHELLHGVLHFEGKLWRTLPLLAWHPGRLTRRYIAGERARFVTPMALFLFSVFTMFAVFMVLGISAPAELNGSAQVRAGVDYARDQARDNRKELIAKRDEAAAGSAERQQVERQLRDVEESLSTLDRVAPGLQTASGGEAHTGWKRLDHGIEKWQKNPGLMLYKLQSSSYKFSWLLIPISLPFMWLLFFWKRGVHMYDHAVFVTYSIAFMSLLFIGITIAAAVGVNATVLAIAGTVIPLWHVHRQLKEAYGLTWFSALWRELVLLVFMGIIALLFVLALLMLGMLG
ncbi:DUF3667 domain-containing protein [Stakelama saccharophila]|uniref:DUF3667 domain-containing protein n=1 Tax=Stakelama saccharophila TaxID=3075605 RepID=A0ABZ0B928_9SPHN|nr:DUF3667 domain-containing protein [Stakelama sp. W311]WNO53794.1 DUF3667 domain-containing protein [Stakelama sp. W311]